MYNPTDTAAEIFRIFGRTNWVMGVLGVVLLAVLTLLELQFLSINTSAPVETKKIYLLIAWFVDFCLFVYALSLPIYRVKNQPYGRAFLLGGIATAGLVLIILLIVAYNRLGNAQTHAGLYGTAIAGIITVLGFLLKVQVDKYLSATAQSLNALLEMRLSEVYNRHVVKVNRCFPLAKKKYISSEDLEGHHATDHEDLYIDSADRAEQLEKMKLRAKSEAISAQSSILNYFEFLALGIKRQVLDEELLYQSLGGIFLNNYMRGKALIDDGDAKNYILIKELHSRWQPRRQKEVEMLSRSQSD